MPSVPADVGAAVGQAALLQRLCPVLEVSLGFPALVAVLIEEDRTPGKSPGMVGEQGDHLLADKHLSHFMDLGVGNLLRTIARSTRIVSPDISSHLSPKISSVLMPVSNATICKIAVSHPSSPKIFRLFEGVKRWMAGFWWRLIPTASTGLEAMISSSRPSLNTIRRGIRAFFLVFWDTSCDARISRIWDGESYKPALSTA